MKKLLVLSLLLASGLLWGSQVALKNEETCFGISKKSAQVLCESLCLSSYAYQLYTGDVGEKLGSLVAFAGFTLRHTQRAERTGLLLECVSIMTQTTVQASYFRAASLFSLVTAKNCAEIKQEEQIFDSPQLKYSLSRSLSASRERRKNQTDDAWLVNWIRSLRKKNKGKHE